MLVPPRRTLPLRRVLEVLIARPDDAQYGYELSEAAGLQSGTIYPLLARLERAGWVTSDWEDVQRSQAAGRPPRRYYRLTEKGKTEGGYLVRTTR